MNPGDTIAALATGPGPSPRAMLRISGPATGEILARLLREPPASAGGHACRLRLDHADSDLDLPCIVLRFFAPRSYTGQDAAEIQLPGNPALIERVLTLILGAAEAVRHAEPGEFTARAFLAGKLSLDQAEGVNALISARGAEQLASAQRLLRGEIGTACRAIADELTGCLALVEAGIDFTDQEDVVAISPDALRARVLALLDRIDRLAGPEAPTEHTSTDPVVVLAGPPNAGKSTLFNALLGRERAVVSDRPGTTRDALRERLDLHESSGAVSEECSRSITLVDLAGLDASLAPSSRSDAASQAAARSALAEADVIVVCRPIGAPPLSEHDLPLEGRAVIRIRTMADLPAGPTSDERRDVLAVCALDGRNLGPLRRAIADAAFGSQTPGLSADGGSVLPRHRRSLHAARQALAEIASEPCEREGRTLHRRPELAAASLRSALDQIGSIVGAVTPDDVIGRIFASFCIGK